MFDLNDFKCPFIPIEKIHEKADTFRDKYWERDDLPVDIELIIEKMGLDIIPTANLKNIDIDAYLKIDLKGIIIDFKTFMDERYRRRVRFSLAHEIGHYVLHKSIIEKMDFQSSDEYFNFIIYLPEEEYGRFEFQANEFAGRILVPHKILKLEIDKISTMLYESNLIEFLDKDPEQVLSIVSSKLCKPFDVSAEVIAIRVEREKLWPPNVKL